MVSGRVWRKRLKQPTNVRHLGRPKWLDMSFREMTLTMRVESFFHGQQWQFGHCEISISLVPIGH